VIFQIHITDTFECTLERAFKTPMLCDVSKVHTGLGVMPRVTHCTEDENWGKPGGTKRVFVAKSLTQKGGEASMDKVIERVENDHWVIEVCEFKAWMLGFHKFTGIWKTSEVSPGKIRIDYTYQLHNNIIIFYPLSWLFAHIFWKKYMWQVMNNIKELVRKEEPYLYS